MTSKHRVPILLARKLGPTLKPPPPLPLHPTIPLQPQSWQNGRWSARRRIARTIQRKTRRATMLGPCPARRRTGARHECEGRAAKAQRCFADARRIRLCRSVCVPSKQRRRPSAARLPRPMPRFTQLSGKRKAGDGGRGGAARVRKQPPHLTAQSAPGIFA
jgi:hypothetical protein